MQIIQISGVVNKEELNPFENFTCLKAVPAQVSNPAYPYTNHKISIDSAYEDEAFLNVDYEEKLHQKRITLFIRKFEHFLRNYYGFVIESENAIYRNYIHFSGIAVIRIYHTVSISEVKLCRAKLPG